MAGIATAVTPPSAPMTRQMSTADTTGKQSAGNKARIGVGAAAEGVVRSVEVRQRN